jgi:2-polyprenyl-3-methyl-5-hydroxy-6-metoxy-1,4-benzoquinol methylase
MPTMSDTVEAAVNMEMSAVRPERVEGLFPCTLCGSTSTILHDNLHDRLFDTPGNWQLLQCTNLKCGLARINPTPRPEVLAAAYENYYTHAVKSADSWLRKQYERLRMGYLSTRFGYCDYEITAWHKIGGNLLALLPHRRAAFDASVMWLRARPSGKVLEIGCGNGDLLVRLRNLGWQVQGIEPDPKSAAIACARGLQVTMGKLAEGAFEPETFDAIVMSHVIEHVDAPVDLMQICRRYLKSDGRLVVLTPNLCSLGHRWFGRDWLHLDSPRHLNLFTPESIVLACQRGGFNKISCATTVRDANWTLAGSMVLRFGRRYRIGELPRLLRIAGLSLLYLEWLCFAFSQRLGEEIVLVARK